MTGRSNVQIPYISLAGDSWAEYKDFIGEVRIDGALRNTTVSTDDIAYFAPKLRGWHTDFSNVNVEVAGVVADFTAKVKSMQIGEGTWLIADASVRGLPDIRQTRFDLNVPRLKSSRRSRRRTGCGDRRPRVVRQAGRHTGQHGADRRQRPLQGAAFVVRHAARRLDRRGRGDPATCG